LCIGSDRLYPLSKVGKAIASIISTNGDKKQLPVQGKKAKI
jgi:hypothetical protein